MRLSATLALLLAASIAHAEPRAMTPAAHAHYERGMKLFATKDYPAAIHEFERGRAIESHPYFVLALGEAYRKAGDCDRAVPEYDAYLGMDPTDDQAKVVQVGLAACAKTTAAHDSDVATAATADDSSAPSVTLPDRDSDAPPPSSAHRRWYADAPGDALAAAGVAGLAIGATYLLRADADISAANTATTVAGIQTHAATGDHERTIGTVALIGGGAFAVAAVVRYVLVSRDRDRGDRGVSVAIAPSGTGAYAVWSGHF